VTTVTHIGLFLGDINASTAILGRNSSFLGVTVKTISLGELILGATERTVTFMYNCLGRGDTESTVGVTEGTSNRGRHYPAVGVTVRTVNRGGISR
jgi:hypothetical protein